MNLIPGLFLHLRSRNMRELFFRGIHSQKKDPDQTGSLNPFSGMRLFLRQKR